MRGISGKRNRKTKPSYADGAASPPCQHHLRRGARNWAFVFCRRDAADLFLLLLVVGCVRLKIIKE